ncbi:MAG: hypothetical protein CM15mP40_00780 [Alphaproteobacteria bacterium]|nr:MAG: hypothetical protein CM15mP40_00780 [Alphaproteobacteria bacterium]
MLPFYGRRLSRKTKRFNSFDLENYEFFFNEINFNDTKKKLVKSFQNVNLEIGFGKGENLIFQSQIKKKDIFLAIDPFISGGLKLKKNIEILKISNIFFSNLTFSQFFEIVGDVNFKKIFILFPDPWPKKKHKKRRLINEEFVKNLDKITLKHSEILIATDDEDYSNQILKSFSKQNFFKLLLKTSDNQIFNDYKIYPTTYFRKAKRENRRINLFIYQK